MSFIVRANPPDQAAERPVANDPWFPPVDPQDVRRACRLDGTVTAERLHQALLAALASVNRELAAWRAQREAEGHTHLAHVPAPQLHGESVKLHHYRRAVHACLMADLSEVYREIDTAPQGASKEARVTEKLELKTADHRRNMRWAISDLMERPRATVELI